MAKSTAAGAGLISGKVGGWVFYVINGEQRIRELTPVTNPQTARQMEIRSINTELSRAWRDVLNEGQRTAWRQRAAGLNTKGGLLFIKQNFVLLDFGLPKQITPPPMVMPPELTDIIVEPDTTLLYLKIPQMTPGTITAQTPFYDVEIAGGFISVQLDTEGDIVEAEINTEALSQGRVHQNSDFRHVVYMQDKPLLEPPSDSEILVCVPAEAVRNVVLRIRRYNKYGNYSQALIFNRIITSV